MCLFQREVSHKACVDMIIGSLFYERHLGRGQYAKVTASVITHLIQLQ